jgi:hypothetical protein
MTELSWSAFLRAGAPVQHEPGEQPPQRLSGGEDRPRIADRTDDDAAEVRQQLECFLFSIDWVRDGGELGLVLAQLRSPLDRSVAWLVLKKLAATRSDLPPAISWEAEREGQCEQSVLRQRCRCGSKLVIWPPHRRVQLTYVESLALGEDLEQPTLHLRQQRVSSGTDAPTAPGVIRELAHTRAAPH